MHVASALRRGRLVRVPASQLRYRFAEFHVWRLRVGVDWCLGSREGAIERVLESLRRPVLESLGTFFRSLPNRSLERYRSSEPRERNAMTVELGTQALADCAQKLRPVAVALVDNRLSDEGVATVLAGLADCALAELNVSDNAFGAKASAQTRRTTLRDSE